MSFNIFIILVENRPMYSPTKFEDILIAILRKGRKKLNKFANYLMKEVSRAKNQWELSFLNLYCKPNNFEKVGSDFGIKPILKLHRFYWILLSWLRDKRDIRFF